MKIPESIVHANCRRTQTSEPNNIKNIAKSLFRTKVVVTEDCINVEGEGAPNVIGLFKENTQERSSMNRYDCDLPDLPVIILQQVYQYNFRNGFSTVMKLSDLLVIVCRCSCNVCTYKYVMFSLYICMLNLIERSWWFATGCKPNYTLASGGSSYGWNKSKPRLSVFVLRAGAG